MPLLQIQIKYTILLWLLFKVKSLSEMLKRLKRKEKKKHHYKQLCENMNCELNRLLKFNAFLSHGQYKMPSYRLVEKNYCTFGVGFQHI